MSKSRKPKYWVVHLETQDRQPNAIRNWWLAPFAIQLLTSEGGPSERIVYIEASAIDAQIDGQVVPFQVVEAVKSLAEGEGRYLDPEGQEVEPGF